ncbi:MAG TPA: GMC family oxidoreductase [Acidimicrobiales bacterium]
MQDGQRVVVIGSGPAGAMAAHRLVRRGIPTTVLESGTAYPRGLLLRAAGRNLFRLGDRLPPPTEEFVPTGDPAATWTFNLAPGGLSNQWTGAVPRFATLDFTDGARVDERFRWPIGYDDLAPYYTEAEALLDVTASVDDLPALPAGSPAHVRRLPRDWNAVAEAAARQGQGFTVLPLADGPSWLVTRQGTAFNSFTKIIRPLMASPLFELRTGAHALRLDWSGATRRVEAVVYHDRASGEQMRLTAAAVVVACGALRSTKLLFDSACPDFPEGIGNAEGLLGTHLHDHPKEWWSFVTDKPVSRLSPAAYLTRRSYSVSEPLLSTSWTLGLAKFSDRVLSLTPLRTHRVGVQVFGSMRPTPDRYVRPHPTDVDEFGLPQLELSIRFSPEELDNVTTSRSHLLSLMADAGYACTLDPVVPQLVPGNAVHYGGTMRMHRSPAFGVVNEWGRPFDVPNVVVGDASVFTTNTEKNPTLTAMALSARAADRLADDLVSGS